MTMVIRNCQLIDCFWLPLYCLDFFDWQFLIIIVLSGLLWLTVSDYLCHCIVWPSLIDSFWLPLSLYCLVFFDWQFLITLVIVLSGLLWLTVSDYPCHCIVWPSLIDSFWLPLYCLDFFDWQFLIKLSIKEGQTKQWQW
jgi:hypothetical protein